MGIFDKIKGEFIDIVEWLDSSNDTIVYRFERYENQIKNGAKLIVRESQMAVFFDKGQIADTFKAGMYELKTDNLPILSTLQGWKYGFNSPFKAEVYFVSMRIFTDQKWGTPNPVMMRDPEFGPVRIRARGSYTMQVTDPVQLIKAITGTDGKFTTDEITNYLRDMIITSFVDFLAESKIPVLDLAAKYQELSASVLTKMKPQFEKYGITCENFLIENITLPEEVEKALDARSSMGIIGNLNAYTQYQAATSARDMANNPGGANSGAGMGIGAGIGIAMGNTMMGSFQQGSQPPPPPGAGGSAYYMAVNGQQVGPLSMTDIQAKINDRSLTKTTMVWKQGMAQWAQADTVPELAQLFGQVPPPPPPPPASGN